MNMSKQLVVGIVGLFLMAALQAHAQKLVPAYQVQVFVTNTPHFGSASTTLQQIVEDVLDPTLGRSDDITDHFTTNSGNTALTLDAALQVKGETIVSNGQFQVLSPNGDAQLYVGTNETGLIGYWATGIGDSVGLTTHLYAYDGFAGIGYQALYGLSSKLRVGAGTTATDLAPYIDLQPVGDDIDVVCDDFTIKDVGTATTGMVFQVAGGVVTVSNSQFTVLSPNGDAQLYVGTNETGLIGYWATGIGDSVGLTTHLHAYDGFAGVGYQALYGVGTKLRVGAGATATDLAPYIDLQSVGDDIDVVCDDFTIKDVDAVATNLMFKVETGVITSSNAVYKIGSSARPAAVAGYGFMYVTNAGATNAAVYVLDGADNNTRISPHAGDRWVFESDNQRTGKHIKIDMEAFISAMERATGEKFMEVWYDPRKEE